MQLLQLLVFFIITLFFATVSGKFWYQIQVVSRKKDSSYITTLDPLWNYPDWVGQCCSTLAFCIFSCICCKFLSNNAWSFRDIRGESDGFLEEAGTERNNRDHGRAGDEGNEGDDSNDDFSNDVSNVEEMGLLQDEESSVLISPINTFNLL